MHESVGVFLKGLGMGAANVIPGVSGGTIALITGIYPRIIQSLRHAFQPETIKHFLGGRWRDAWARMDGTFLLVLGTGVLVSIITLARGFEFLLTNFEAATMAFFFGLVAISVPQVGRTVGSWNAVTTGALLFGTAVAVGLAFIAPSEANPAFGYLVICGVAAICSMVLPGLSGSFVLMLMGNYVLVLRAIKGFDLGILVPMAIGCGAGLLGFVQVIGWALKRAPNAVIALMTGFVLGSLLTIWPWKVALHREVTVAGEPRLIPTGFEWRLPERFDAEFFIALALMLGGALFLHVVHAQSQKMPRAPEPDEAADDVAAAGRH